MSFILRFAKTDILKLR